MKIETFIGYPYFHGDNWCARCAKCRRVLTKFAFTEEEARREAESEPCGCKTA